MKLHELRDLFQAVRPVLKNALLSGRLFRPQCTLTEPAPDVLAEYDVRIPRSDGTTVTANVFRSKRADAAGEAQPAIMCAHPYDNRLIPALGNTPLGGPPQQYRMIPQQGKPAFSTLTSWEAPDPDFWVRAGYAVVNMNMPGYASSGGRPTLFSPDQADAFGEAIDWVGEQPWCTGNVGLSGVSYLAISQWAVAAGQTPRGVPRCLKAISPWEGVTNFCQDLFYEGGVQEIGFPVFWWFTEVKPTIRCTEAEFIESVGFLPMQMGDHHPFYDDYWAELVPKLADIDLPMLVCASFSDQGLHTRGSFRAFMQAKSAQKWVYTHRGLKWDVFYSEAAKQRMRAFFDCFLKGETDNGFLDHAPVRLEVRSARERIHEVRDEQEWPLARTEYRKLFLTGAGGLVSAPPANEIQLAYDARKGSMRFRHVFAEDTELTGYMKLHLDVEARGHRPGADAPDDLVLFVGIDKLDRAGERVPFFGSVGNHHDGVARGLLKVSRRALDKEASTEWQPILQNVREEKLAPGEVVAIDVAINPSSTFFAQGEALELIISPNEVVPSPPFRKRNDVNRGLHVLYLGGTHDAHLLVPVIPKAS